jgi:CubicO group peptidase (beta-lactamase class C family)
MRLARLLRYKSVEKIRVKLSKNHLKLAVVLMCGALSVCFADTLARPRSADVLPKHSKLNLRSFEHGLRPTVLRAGEAAPHWSIRERMAHYYVPGVAVAILKHGKVAFAAGYGVRSADSKEAVNADTLFSVGSVSKVVVAATTLRRVAEGKVDLNRDVDSYLTSWHIPTNPKFPKAVVTLRMLMSHTSGLNVHGFEDFPPNEPRPTLVQTLNGTGPAKGKHDPVHLIYKPGTRFHYSGGGVEVEQLVIENLTGSPLQAVARKQVFDPLGMRRSTFTEPLPAKTRNVAKAYNAEGEPDALPRGWQSFPEQAASGLWTTANDLGKFVGALIKSYHGAGDFLPEPIARDMMTEVSPSSYGLGPNLGGTGKTRFFYHGGANKDYRAWIERHLETGNGLVILTNGANGGELYFEIRNAVADMLGWRIDRPVQAIHLGSNEQKDLKDFSGAYHADDVPMDMRQGLVGIPDAVEIRVKNGQVFLHFPGREKDIALLSLTPTRFVVAHVYDPAAPMIVFHRGADDRVRALTIEMGPARAYYTREAAGTQ